MNAYIGIDPGKNGGIAVIDGHGITAEVMPLHPDGEINVVSLQEFFVCLEEPIAAVEKVGAMPKQGVVSTFTFGKGYGKVLACLEMLGIPYVLVTPQAWKKTVLEGLNWKGNKKASIEYCQRRYPQLDLLATPRSKVAHDGMADALCIAEYVRRTER